MSKRPQQQELARSQHTPLDPSERARQSEQAGGPNAEDSPDAVPEENEPGHRPENEQDKPDPERFRQRLAGEEDADEQDDEHDDGE